MLVISALSPAATKFVVEFPATVASEKLDADCRSVVVDVVDSDVDVVNVVFGDKFVIVGAIDAWGAVGDVIVVVVVVFVVVVVAVVGVSLVVVVVVVVDVVVVGTTDADVVFVIVVDAVVGNVVGDSKTTSIQ